MSRSSTKAEYRSLANTAAELNWTVSMIKEMGITLKLPLKLACDNLAAKYLARNPVYHGKTKHVVISYHFVLEQVGLGQLEIEHVRLEDQPADILTKPLPTTMFNRMKSNLICKLPMSLRGGISQTNQLVC